MEKGGDERMGADIVGTLYVVLGLQDDASGEIDAAMTNIEGSTRRATNSMMDNLTDWRDETNASVREYARWAMAIGAYTGPIIAAGAVAYAEIEKFGSLADEIRDLSYETGLGTKTIQELRYAAVLSNTSISDMKAGATNLSLAIANAKDRSSEAGKAFATLGVSTDGRSYDEIFEDTARAIVGVRDETQRAAIASTLYGRSWREFLPYINDYVNNANEIKGVDYLTDEQLKDLEVAKAQIDSIGYKWTIAEGKVVAYFATVNEEAKKLESDEPTYLEQMLNSYSQFQEDFWKNVPGGGGAGGRAGLDTLPEESITFPVSYEFLLSGMSDLDVQIAEMETITLPALKKAWDDAIAAGDPEAIKQAAFAYAVADRELVNMKNNTDALTDATREYSDSLKKVLDLEQDRADLNADTAEDLQNAVGDPEQFRSILKEYRRSVREGDQSLGAAEANVRAAGAAVYNTVNPGSVKSGDVIIMLDGKEIRRVKGVANTAGDETFSLSKSDLTKAGVRMS